MAENTQDWLQLNWVKNHARFYFSASHLGHPDQDGDKKRDSFEVLSAGKQCEEAAKFMSELKGTPEYHANLDLQINTTECYICGLKITEGGGLSMKSPAGHQCEHILTASTIAMLVGLPGTIYEKTSMELITDLHKNSIMKDKYDEFYQGYQIFQKELWPLLYDWSHPTCNEYKGNNPFLRIDFKSKGIKVYPLSKTSDNIKKLLGILLYKEIDPSKESKISLWRDNVLHAQLSASSDIDSFALTRYRSIIQKMQLIIAKLNKYSVKDGGELLKQYSYLSTKTMLNVIIGNVLQLGPFKWVKPLHSLFKQSGNELKTYIEDTGGDNVPMNKLLKFLHKQKGGGSDDIIYYTEETLTDDVIVGALLLLKLKNPDLFSEMNIDRMMFNIDMIDIDELIGRKTVSPMNIQLLDQCKQFCNFFRFYINSENAVKYSVNSDYYKSIGLSSDIINTHFKMSVISITNYIWNIYSNYYNLEEAIVDGTSETLDGLMDGPTLDERALQYLEMINMIKLLESMGNELKDISKGVSKRKIPRGLEKSLGVQKAINKPSQKRTHKKKSRVKSINNDELRNMTFMVGDKVLSF